MLKKLENKTFARLVYSLCAVFLIPIIVLYILYTNSMVQTMEEEAVSIVSNDLASSMQLLDSELQALESSAKAFQRGSSYQSYLEADPRSTDLLPLLQQMEGDIMYTYIHKGFPADDFFVLLPEHDTVLSLSGRFDQEEYLSEYFAQSESSSHETLEFLLSFSSNVILRYNDLTTRGGRGEYLVYVYPLTQSRTDVSATVVFCVAAEQFASYFQTGATEYQTSTFAYKADGTYLFSHSADQQMLQYMAKADRVNSFETGPSPITLFGCEYVAIKQISQNTNWSYITLLPQNNNLVQKLSQISNSFRLYFFLVILLGFLIISVALQVNYKPIRHLREKAKQVTVPNSQDDFTAISDTLTYLQDKNTELDRAVRQNLNEITSSRLYRLLGGYYSNIEDFNEDCDQIGLTLHGSHFYVSIFRFDHFPESMMKEVTELVKHELDTSLESKWIPMPKRYEIVFIHFAESADTPISLRAFSSAVEMLHDQFCLSACVGIGHMHAGVETISRSYMQATSALDLKSVNSSATVISYDDALAYFADSYQYPTKEMNRLESALNTKNTSGVDQTLKEIIAYIGEHDLSLLNARCIASDITKILMAESTIMQMTGQLLSETIMRLNYAKNNQQIIAALQQVCTKIASTDHKPGVDDKLLDEIIAFIEGNYWKPEFSVQEIAEHFEMLSTNIGNYFKGKMDCGLLEYLINRRMRRAKELLRTTDMPVKEISYCVGYYNVSSFIRRFKQNEGITPNEYRAKE